MKSLRVRLNYTTIIKYFLLLVWTIITLYPLIFTVVSSLKTQNDMFSNLFGLPKAIIFDNYIKLFTQIKMGRNIINSLIVSTCTVALQMTISSAAAFVLARFNFRIKTGVRVFFMFGLLVPIQSVMVPVAMIAKQVNGYNSLLFLTVIYTAFQLPYYIFILTGFMKNIPKEIEESAVIDGASFHRVFINFIVPLSIPSIASLSILSFFSAWNELLLALILLKKDTTRTVSVALLTFAGDMFADYPGLCAAVVVTVIPTVIIYILLQKNIVQGIAAGAVKG